MIDAYVNLAGLLQQHCVHVRATVYIYGFNASTRLHIGLCVLGFWPKMERDSISTILVDASSVSQKKKKK